jgi:formylglycine-generating enzyme required for sulfatase activity
MGAAKGCCAPARSGSVEAPTQATPGASAELLGAVEASLVPLKGGFFGMGGRQSAHEADLDSPPRRVAVSPFRIGRTTVTNTLFAAFVAESGYVTTAEREGWSFVFHLFLPDPRAFPVAPQGTPWWRQVEGADWAHPEGPGSGIQGREDHPVTHVSWHDAIAFCVFTGTRLPREAEWEFAARGGRRRGRYPWGNDPTPGGRHLHNVWKGEFPFRNSGEDGFVGTAPSDAFPPNGYGLYAMTGNVWEWCADGFGPLPQVAKGVPRDPEGADQGRGRVMRGGSYLCDASYCERYYVHSRTSNAPESSTGNIGFRIAA